MENTTDKERMTLWLGRSIKDELKQQAKSNGVSVSAYVSMLVSLRKAGMEIARDGINFPEK